MVMEKDAKIYIAGHRGLVGAAIKRKLEKDGYTNLVFKTHAELDLTRQADVERFFEQEKPVYAFVAAAKVGGIHANNTYPADFIGINLQIQTNIIDAAYKSGVKKLLFLGSSCIYPKLAAQPIVEESLLTGPLEPTNEWYAVAKIAGIKMCQAYRLQVSPCLWEGDAPGRILSPYPWGRGWAPCRVSAGMSRSLHHKLLHRRHSRSSATPGIASAARELCIVATDA